MSKSISTFLRRSTRYPAGIATGGGETGFYPQPQHHAFTVALWGGTDQFRDVLLPKGTLITHYLTIPFNGNDSLLDGVAATAGAWTLDTWNITTNASISSLQGATLAKDYSLNAVSSPVALTAETRLRFRISTAFTPYTAGAAGNGASLVGFYAYMPRIRP